MSGQGEPEQLEKTEIDSGVLKTLGVMPALGRGFNSGDEREGAADVALLSDSLAGSLFGSAGAALGRTVRLDNQPYQVVGVMPRSFAFPSREVQLWTPLRFPASSFTDPDDRANTYLSTVARLRAGVPAERAQADVAFISKRIERAFPKQNAGVGANVFPLRDAMTMQSRMLVFAVFGAALCVLLIACTNLANLLLARGMARKREMAVRIAIGAGRERLLRQLFTENLVLAVAGGALGLVLAMAATPSLARLVPDALPVSGVPEMDFRVFAFAAALTLGTSLAFGIGPALRASGKVDLTALRAKAGGGGHNDRLRRALVLTEVAVTVTLLVSTGLLLKALWRIQAVDPGFRTENVLTLRTALPLPRYEAVAPRMQFYNRVLTQARALPGVEAAGYISFLPLTNRGGLWPVMKPGEDEHGASTPRALLRFVTPGFFGAMGIQLRGRDVGERDTGSAPFVAVVSEALAKRFWPNQDAIGLQFKVAFFERTVVGVARDISMRGLERTSEPQIYLPAAQVPDGGLRPYGPKDLVVRVSGQAGGAAGFAPALRRIIRQADPEQAVSEVRDSGGPGSVPDRVAARAVAGAGCVCGNGVSARSGGDSRAAVVRGLGPLAGGRGEGGTGGDATGYPRHVLAAGAGFGNSWRAGGHASRVCGGTGNGNPAVWGGAGGFRDLWRGGRDRSGNGTGGEFAAGSAGGAGGSGYDDPAGVGLNHSQCAAQGRLDCLRPWTAGLQTAHPMYATVNTSCSVRSSRSL